MPDFENGSKPPNIIPVETLPSLDQEGYLMGKNEQLTLQLSPDFDPNNMKSYSDPDLEFDIAGKPVAIIRAGGVKEGTYQDYVVVDMRHLPITGFEKNSFSPDFGESVWGLRHTKRELPNGDEGLGDIAIVRPRSDGEYDITALTEIYRAGDFGRTNAHGASLSHRPEAIDQGIPIEVSRDHFSVFYDNQTEQITISNNHPTNRTVIFNGDQAQGSPAEWDPNVKERAIDRQIARLAMQDLVAPPDLAD